MAKTAVSLVILAVTIGVPLPVAGYDDETTHPALADGAVDFYNRLYPGRTLTAEEKEWIVEGSVSEDDWPRWLNHFYDPVRKIGWAGERQGIATPEATRAGAYAAVVPLGAEVLPATKWIHDRAMQAGPYARMGGDRTWARAIQYYVEGNHAEAYRTLGHALHLLQDMTVPDHSRNDSHAPLGGDDGSPFEDYLKKWNRANIGDLKLVDNLVAQQAKPPTFASVEDYFIEAAEYSNKYFFSKDTINSDVHALPRIIRDDGNFAYGIGENGIEFPIAKATISKTEDSEIQKSFSLLGLESYRPILDAYFERLAPKAVLYGAGIIELFHKQAEEALEFKDIGTRVTRFDFSRITSLFSFSPAAALKSIWRGLASLPSLIGGAAISVVETLEEKFRQEPESVVRSFSESSSLLQDLRAGNQEDGAVIDAEEERQVLREFQNQLDDIADQVSDLTYEISVATGKGGVDGVVDVSEDDKEEHHEDDAIEGTEEFAALAAARGGGSAAANPPNFSITEIMYNVSGADDGREWIEIINGGTAAENAENARFFEGGVHHRLTLVRGSALLGVGGYAVIADDAARFLAEYPGFSGNLFDSSFSLSNAGETLALSFEGNTFHSVAYSSSTGAAGDGNSLQLVSGVWIAAPPTPGVANVAFSISDGSTGAESETLPATSSPPTAGTGAGHVVISEVMVSGVDAGDEFIELYNPTDAAVDLSGWSLQYVSGAATSVSSSTVSKKNFLATSSIAAKGFYLIGRGVDGSGGDGYRGDVAPDMTHRTFTLSGALAGAKLFLVAATTLIESELDPTIIDVLDYTSAAIPEPGGSFERRAWSGGLCHSAVSGGSGEFLGNACDSDVFGVDFELRAEANPQNRASFGEPRAAPPAPLPAGGALTFAEYVRDSVSIDFAWEPSVDFQGSTSTITYRITETSASEEIWNGTSTSFSFALTEVGRVYPLTLQAFDRDGLGSATTSAAIDVPSFLDTLHLYRDPATSTTAYFLDLFYGGYPFIPHRYSSGDAWRVAVFYLNRDPSTEMHFETWSPGGETAIPAGMAESILAVKFRDCSGTADRVRALAVIPDAAGKCAAAGPFSDDVAFALLEDFHLRFTLASTSDSLALGAEDYVTVAFYDYSSPFWASVARKFSLVAVDANRYYFTSTTPPFAAPVLPDAVTADLDAGGSRIVVRWETATDVDTLDDRIEYEIAFWTSGELGEGEWQSAEPQPRADLDDTSTVSHRFLRQVAPGQAFTVGMRARDEFGATSTARTLAWEYPMADEVFVQAQANGWSAAWGEKAASQPLYPDTASVQSFTPGEAITFDVATVRVWHEEGSDEATLRLAVYGDSGAGGVDYGNKIAEALVGKLLYPSSTQDIAFTFPSQLSFAGGATYWFVLDLAASGWDGNAGFFRNKWKNAITTGTDLLAGGQAGKGAGDVCPNFDFCGTVVPYPDPSADWYLKLHRLR